MDLFNQYNRPEPVHRSSKRLTFWLCSIFSIISFAYYLLTASPIIEPCHTTFINNSSSNSSLLFIIIDGLPARHFSKLEVTKNATSFAPLIAACPTSTTTCLKTIFTGRDPSLFDFRDSFKPSELDVPNWVSPLIKLGVSVRSFGENTFVSMFPESYSKSHDSFNVRDFSSHDALIKVSVDEIKNHTGPSLTWVHFLGYDHLSHVYGPDSLEALASLSLYDSIIKDLISGYSGPDDSILLASDHGFDDKGHGGCSSIERDTYVFSWGIKLKKRLTQQKDLATISFLFDQYPPDNALSTMFFHKNSPMVKIWESETQDCKKNPSIRTGKFLPFIVLFFFVEIYYFKSVGFLFLFFYFSDNLISLEIIPAALLCLLDRNFTDLFTFFIWHLLGFRYNMSDINYDSDGISGFAIAKIILYNFLPFIVFRTDPVFFLNKTIATMIASLRYQNHLFYWSVWMPLFMYNFMIFLIVFVKWNLKILLTKIKFRARESSRMAALRRNSQLIKVETSIIKYSNKF